MNNRTERHIFFLVVWFTMFSCYNGWGQNPVASTGSTDFLRLKYPGEVMLYAKPTAVRNAAYQAAEGHGPVYLGVVRYGVSALSQDLSSYTLPPNLYYVQSGYFCKREWDLEKATHIPFRFRLGSLADCNALEGKH